MKRQRGFTLLELLIAVAIFALVGAMAYGGLQQVLDQNEHTGAQSQRLSDLQKAYAIMQRDIEQLTSRKIRNGFGDTIDALVGGSGFNGVEFSRAGHANPAGFLRSDIQRVAYVPDQETLLRRTWRVLDRAQDSLPDEQVLIEGMQRFSVRFLDQANEWQEQWPPQSAQLGTSVDAGMPRAVEVQLELDDVGILNWLFGLPENFEAPLVNPAGAADSSGGGSENSQSDAGQDSNSEQTR
jgi:general secretion pathway protein J